MLQENTGGAGDLRTATHSMPDRTRHRAIRWTSHEFFTLLTMVSMTLWIWSLPALDRTPESGGLQRMHEFYPLLAGEFKLLETHQDQDEERGIYLAGGSGVQFLPLECVNALREDPSSISGV